MRVGWAYVSFPPSTYTVAPLLDHTQLLPPADTDPILDCCSRRPLPAGFDRIEDALLDRSLDCFHSIVLVHRRRRFVTATSQTIASMI